jgi:hypothetical protein
MNCKANNRRITKKVWSGPQLVVRLLLLCLWTASGCRVVEETAKLPMRTVNAVTPTKQEKQLDPAELQEKVLNYADDFLGRTSTSLDEYARRMGTPKARSDALTWKLALSSSILAIATGANPAANLADLLALSSISRAFLEQRAPEIEPRGALDPWLESSRVLETNAWKIADEVLTAEQQAEFRAALKQWLVENAGTRSAFFRRPQELAAGIRLAREKDSQPGSVFSLVGLDPTSGLDPAVREVTRTRLFAERALFAAQHMPFLIRWQTELLVQQLLREDQLTNALAIADRISRAVESASLTAALLPDRISAERKAILDSLNTQEGRLRDLSVEATRTVEAGEKMSMSLNTTIISFDALMKRFGVGEPSTAHPDTNSPPFNILDYAHAAEQVATMAQHLDVLIKDVSGTVDTPALDKRIAQLNALSDRARVDAKSVLNHAFLLAAGLLVLGFACALVYRRLATRTPAEPANLRSPQPTRVE